MVVAVRLFGRAEPLDCSVEGMGAAKLVDTLVPSDMGSTLPDRVPERVVAGYSDKVPVDTVDIQRCSRDIEMKRSPCQFLLDLWRLFDQWLPGL